MYELSYVELKIVWDYISLGKGIWKKIEIIFLNKHLFNAAIW